MKDEILDFMPRALTAENGAKYALNGYFNEKVEVPNPDFCGCGECDYCKEFPETPETILQNVPIRWTTIKEIYAKAVQHFEQQKSAENGTNEN